MLSTEQIDQAAELLVAARLDNAVLDAIPESCRPMTLAEAYAVQDRFIERLGWPTGGWYCACTNRVIQELLGLDEPYCARLLSEFIFHSPAGLDAGAFPPMVLECEFGFRLGQDLPPRDRPYERPEVEAAIESVHPTIEVVAGHLRDWPNQDVWSVIADNGTDGALIVGTGISDWRALDLTALPVTLSVNGETKRRGCGANVLGDPVGSFVWLANSRAGAGAGLKAGDIHNTGTATDICWVNAGDEAVADFAALGDVRLKIAPGTAEIPQA